MSEGSKRAAKGPVSDGELWSKEENPDFTGLQDRLAQARIRRAEILSKRDQKKGMLKETDLFPGLKPWEEYLSASKADDARQQVSHSEVPDVEETRSLPRWNDPIAKARLRRAEVLARRDKINEPGSDPGKGKNPIPDKSSIYYALAGDKEPPTERPEWSDFALDPEKASFSYKTTPSESPRRRYGVGLLAVGVILAFLIGVFSSGWLRDYAVLVANQVVERYYGLPDNPSHVQDAGEIRTGTVALGSNPGILVSRPVSGESDVTTIFLGQEGLAADDNLPLFTSPAVITTITAELSPPGIPDFAGSYRDLANLSVAVITAMPDRFSSRSLSEALPTHLDDPLDPGTTGQVTDGSRPTLIEQASTVTETAVEPGPVPAVTEVIAVLSLVSENSEYQRTYQIPAKLVTAVEQKMPEMSFLAASAADVSVSTPNRITRFRVATFSTANPATTKRVSSVEFEASVPGPDLVAPAMKAPGLLQRVVPHADTAIVTAPPEPFADTAVRMSAVSARDALDTSDTAARPLDADIVSVHVHAPQSIPETELNTILAAFRATGYPIKSPKRVGFRISKNNVRFFHARDADAARVLAAVVGGIARDFTDYTPPPPVGTVEVWLAGNLSPRRAPAAKRSAGTPTPTTEDARLHALRDRLLKSLRSGDHL